MFHHLVGILPDGTKERGLELSEAIDPAFLAESVSDYAANPVVCGRRSPEERLIEILSVVTARNRMAMMSDPLRPIATWMIASLRDAEVRRQMETSIGIAARVASVFGEQQAKVVGGAERIPRPWDLASEADNVEQVRRSWNGNLFRWHGLADASELGSMGALQGAFAQLTVSSRNLGMSADLAARDFLEAPSRPLGERLEQLARSAERSRMAEALESIA